VSEKGGQRIDQIIRAARDTLIHRGYHGFTMRGVAAECGISVGNLNYYYANKADLLADLLDIALQGYIAGFDAILAESDPALCVLSWLILALRKRPCFSQSFGRWQITMPVPRNE
jgi:AcrR family transcriptional regulator